jgi:hypothetical protein
MQRMASGVRVVPTRGRAFVVAALLATACSSTALVLPASAAAKCHQVTALAGVASYSGTASASYVSGALTSPPDDSGFQETTSLSHTASGLKIAGLKRSGPDFSAQGQPTGGSVEINDNYSDTLGGLSHQSANGPTSRPANGVTIEINSSKCTYQLLFSFDIKTTTVVNQPGIPDDPGVEDDVTTPTLPIPASLDLQGSASIPASGGGADGGDHGLYDLSANPTWPLDLEFADGGISPVPATTRWSLKPVKAKKQGHGKRHR